MNATPEFWLSGYENAALRKRLAYFRPWIEDRSVLFIGEDPVSLDYVQNLASGVCEEGEFDLVFAPGVTPQQLAEVHARALHVGSAFVGWSSEASPKVDAETIFQSADWPFSMTNQKSSHSQRVFVSPGSLEPIRHPSVGIVIPTHSHPRSALEAIAAYAAEYPGEASFALVANGVGSSAIEELKKAISFDRGHIDLIALEDNKGFGQGCNAGLERLVSHPDLDYFAVSNDDVLPGTDCLYELINCQRELAALGHNPGVVGPVSNEVNGAQKVNIGAFANVAEMRCNAHRHWAGQHSEATQALQVRGLLLVMSRDCLVKVGGFDPRFGIGNFEDDDHNLRTRLAGFTLWIASGAFLFHHGSSTFKSLKVDYEANIRRNAESMMRKWGLSQLEEWVSLSGAPKGVSIHQPLKPDKDPAHVIRINGESVDLINQASDIEFAAWIMGQTPARTAEGRKALVELIESSKVAA